MIEEKPDADEEPAGEERAAVKVARVTPEQLARLAESAQAVMKDCQGWCAQHMTRERAQYVRDLRVVRGYTWRAVAEACCREWQGPWDPPSNQLMGMALCESAATMRGERYREPPWN